MTQATSNTPRGFWQRVFARLLPPHHPHSLAEAVLGHIPFVTFVAFLVACLEFLGFFESLHQWPIGLAQRLKPLRQSQHIVCIYLSREELHALKQPAASDQHSRPQLPAKMFELVELLEQREASVIGIDIASDDWVIDELPEAIRKSKKIIWARRGQRSDADVAQPPFPCSPSSGTPPGDKHSGEHEAGYGDKHDGQHNHVGEHSAEHAHHHAPELRRFNFLAGLFDETSDHDGRIETAPRSGIVNLPPEEDGLVRGFWPAVESPTAEPAVNKNWKRQGSGLTDTFIWEIATTFRPQIETLRPKLSAGHHPPGIDFSSSFEPLRSYCYNQELIDRLKQPDPARPVLVKDQIVLIGGHMPAADDMHSTPVGPRNGLLLLAEAIDGLLAKRWVTSTNLPAGFLFDVALALSLVALNYQFDWRGTPWWNLPIILAVTFLPGIMLYWTTAYWFNGGIVLLATWLELVAHAIGDYRRLTHENQSLADRVQQAELESSNHRKTIDSLTTRVGELDLERVRLTAELGKLRGD